MSLSNNTSSDEGGWKTINKKRKEKKDKKNSLIKKPAEKKMFVSTPVERSTKSGRMVQRASSFDNTCNVRDCKNAAGDKNSKCAASFCRRYYFFCCYLLLICSQSKIFFLLKELSATLIGITKARVQFAKLEEKHLLRLPRMIRIPHLYHPKEKTILLQK